MSTNEIFGGDDSEIFGGDCGGCSSEGVFGGSIKAFKHLSDGGQVNLMAWGSLALSIASFIILSLLLLPWVAPELWKSIIGADNVAGQFARWLSAKDIKYLFGVLAAYVVWHECSEWAHW